jgi:hypothetical protein
LRAFVVAAGEDGRNFQHDGEYGVALGELRVLVGQQVALIAYQYRIEVEAELAEILPHELQAEGSIVPILEDMP